MIHKNRSRLKSSTTVSFCRLVECVLLIGGRKHCVFTGRTAICKPLLSDFFVAFAVRAEA